MLKNCLKEFSVYELFTVGASTVEVFKTATNFGIFTRDTEKSDCIDPTALGFSNFIQIIYTSSNTYAHGNFTLTNNFKGNIKRPVKSIIVAIPEPETYEMLLATIC